MRKGDLAKSSHLAELPLPGSGAAGTQAKSGRMVDPLRPSGEGLGRESGAPQWPPCSTLRTLLAPRPLRVEPSSWAGWLLES